MKFLQKLGKALMLPVAILPICGILMGIGYRLCPATMQGGDIQGAVNLIGLFLVKAGGALIDNMAILFAIGVGVGMSEKNDGTGGIAALASWLMMTTLLSTGFVTTIMPSIADSATKDTCLRQNRKPVYRYSCRYHRICVLQQIQKHKASGLVVFLQWKTLCSNYCRSCFYSCICCFIIRMAITFRSTCCYWKRNRWTGCCRSRYLCIPQPSAHSYRITSRTEQCILV